MNIQATADTEMTDELVALRVVRKEQLAAEIWLYELCDHDGANLPEFTAGSHVMVQTPAGFRRTYSLCNDPGLRNAYQIAVKRDARGRGGSISMVDQVQAGDTLLVGKPRNHFELASRASRFIFIAGGIGITPILSMMRFLKSAGRAQSKLFYCVRDPGSTAFQPELKAEFPAQVHIHHDYGALERALDLWPVLEKPSNAHVYCCGPRGLMESVRDMSGHWPSGSVHFESFGVDAKVRAGNKPFKIRLLKSDATLEVAADQSIMEAARAAGYRVPSSCESGVCGACKTRLLAGVADHRDMVLSDREKSSQIIVCVSRAQSPELILDL